MLNNIKKKFKEFGGKKFKENMAGLHGLRANLIGRNRMTRKKLWKQTPDFPKHVSNMF
jgi:hypothetical protein